LEQESEIVLANLMSTSGWVALAKDLAAALS
jgi:hypothetical protein